jgi:hypothetical protein
MKHLLLSFPPSDQSSTACMRQPFSCCECIMQRTKKGKLLVVCFELVPSSAHNCVYDLYLQKKVSIIAYFWTLLYLLVTCVQCPPCLAQKPTLTAIRSIHSCKHILLFFFFKTKRRLLVILDCIFKKCYILDFVIVHAHTNYPCSNGKRNIQRWMIATSTTQDSVCFMDIKEKYKTMILRDHR